MSFEQLDKYYEMFGDAFPLSELKGHSEQEQEKMLQECIDKKKPYHELYETNNEVNY